MIRKPGHSIARILLPAARFALTLAIVLVLGVGAAPLAQARAFTVLYNFTGGNDGGDPQQSGPLARDSSGDLFGTTSSGGTNNSGTLFKLRGSTLTPLHSFYGKNLAAGVILDSPGTIYGTTEHGGPGGCGTVYQIRPSGLKRLHGFTCGSDGGYPFTTVVRDKHGNLYGTTSSGGSTDCSGGCGVLYQVSRAGVFTVLHTFTGPDGVNPSCNLTLDQDGNIYGMAGGGKNGFGVVFELSKSSSGWKETVLHNFTGSDGGGPTYGGLTLITRRVGGKRTNEFFGVTEIGAGKGCNGAGCGVAFQMIQTKTGYELTVLHVFTGSNGDGAYPVNKLIRINGNLFGTTYQGGSGNCPGGCGILFELSQHNGGWTENILHSFTGNPDGGFPINGVVADPNGNLYGTAQYGSTGYGVVYEMTP